MINLLTNLFRDQGYVDDGMWDWVIYKKELLENRHLAELEAQRHKRSKTIG
jgi:hypothetical protein